MRATSTSLAPPDSLSRAAAGPAGASSVPAQASTPADSPTAPLGGAVGEPPAIRHGTLAVQDAQRARELVGAALDQMGARPEVLVNRAAREAANLLERGGFFPTAFDDASPAPRGYDRAILPDYLRERLAHEKRLGIHGEGPLAGRTVYGSLQIAPTLAAADAAQGARLNTGATRYGEVAFVLKPEALQRASMTANDSFYTTAQPLPAHRWQDAVTERLLYDFKGIVEPTGTSSPWNDKPRGLLRRRLQGMLGEPDQQALARVRDHLEHGHLTRNYVEVQVPGASIDDVAEVRVELDPAYAPRWRGAEAAQEVERELDRIVAAAAARGIPVRIHRPDVPEPATAAPS